MCCHVGNPIKRKWTASPVAGNVVDVTFPDQLLSGFRSRLIKVFVASDTTRSTREFGSTPYEFVGIPTDVDPFELLRVQRRLTSD